MDRLKPGDIILNDNTRSYEFMVVAIIPTCDTFARITVLEPWPEILSTYTVFYDQQVGLVLPC